MRSQQQQSGTRLLGALFSQRSSRKEAQAWSGGTSGSCRWQTAVDGRQRVSTADGSAPSAAGRLEDSDVGGAAVAAIATSKANEWTGSVFGRSGIRDSPGTNDRTGSGCGPCEDAAAARGRAYPRCSRQICERVDTRSSAACTPNARPRDSCLRVAAVRLAPAPAGKNLRVVAAWRLRTASRATVKNKLAANGQALHRAKASSNAKAEAVLAEERKALKDEREKRKAQALLRRPNALTRLVRTHHPESKRPKVKKRMTT